jgi:hypothetical protein
MAPRRGKRREGEERAERPGTDRAPLPTSAFTAKRLRLPGLVLALLAPWVLVGWLITHPTPAPPPTPAAAPKHEWKVGRSGPWGVLERHEIMLEPPEPDVTPDLCDARPDTWVFPEQTRAEVLALLDGAGLDESLRGALQAHLRCQSGTGPACRIDPPVEVLVKLPARARAAIYGVLAHYPQNQWYQYGFRRRSDAPETWFAGAGLPAPTQDVVRRLMWRHEGIFVFSDPSAACAQLTTPLDKVRTIRALARTPALLVRLRLEPETSLERLADYWGAGARREHVRSLLESVLVPPEGVTLDLVHLLPPLVRQHLYTYPSPQDPERDCHWTSANYHAGVETDRYLDPRHLSVMLATGFREVPFAERRLGDVLTYNLRDKFMIHSAVYIADDIVFTKNGRSFRDPWILMSLEDVGYLYAPDDHYRIRVHRKR